MSAAEVIIYISIVSGLLPLFAAVYNYRNLDTNLKLFALLCLASVISDILCTALWRWLWHSGIMKNNSPILHGYIILSCLLIGVVYSRAFEKRQLKFTAITIASVITAASLFFFVKNMWAYPSESNTISSIAFIILSLLYFYQLLARQEFVHIEKQGLFWINAGILFYYAVNIFPFMLFTQIIKQHDGDFYTIHDIVNVLANVLFSIGLLCKPQKTTT